jgi:putative phosphoribosyl transferase
VFSDRAHAAKLLATLVDEKIRQRGYDTAQIVVVGLPRGGVPVAAGVARKIGAPLTILASKKIGAPGNPELAVGAVTSTGVAVLSPQIEQSSGRWRQYIQHEQHRLSNATKVLEEHWLRAAGLPQLEFDGKVVILVDDGIATGMTAVAAARSMRKARAKTVLIAAPVIAGESIQALLGECDGLIAITAPTEMGAVGYFYRDFSPVEEDEVVRALKVQPQLRPSA